MEVTNNYRGGFMEIEKIFGDLPILETERLIIKKNNFRRC